MSRVTVTSHDPITTVLYDEQESADLFGDDYIQEYGIEMPAELLNEYKRIYNEFWRVQKELENYLKGITK